MCICVCQCTCWERGYFCLSAYVILCIRLEGERMCLRERSPKLDPWRMWRKPLSRFKYSTMDVRVSVNKMFPLLHIHPFLTFSLFLSLYISLPFILFVLRFHSFSFFSSLSFFLPLPPTLSLPPSFSLSLSDVEYHWKGSKKSLQLSMWARTWAVKEMEINKKLFFNLMSLRKMMRIERCLI